MPNWKIKARKAGRICPECKQPQTIAAWAGMVGKRGTRSCPTCRFAHWEIPLKNAGGSVMMDNAGREALDYIRSTA